MRSAIVFGCALLIPVTAMAGFRVSSARDAGKSREFDAASAIDDNPATAWQIDPESEQKGEWIEIDLPKGDIDKIAVMVGWEKSEETWGDYGRIKTGRLEVFSDTDEAPKKVLETTVTFEDKKGMQLIDIEDTAVGSELFGGKARLTITDFTPGQDYPAVAVSEVRIVMKEFDAAPTFAEAPSASADGHDEMNMIDDNTRTYFLSSGEEPVSFTLDASGYGLSSVVITPGPKTHARPKVVEIDIADQTRTHTLADDGKPQVIPLPSIIGYTGSAWGQLKVTVKETYEGSKPGVGIAEVDLKATNYDGF